MTFETLHFHARSFNNTPESTNPATPLQEKTKLMGSWSRANELIPQTVMRMWNLSKNSLKKMI